MAGLGAFGKFNEFWRVVRDLNPKAVQRDIERGFSLALLGSDEEGKQALRAALRPCGGHAPQEYLLEVDNSLAGPYGNPLPPRADLYLYVANAERGLTGSDISVLEQLYLMARPTALLFSSVGRGSSRGELGRVERDLSGLVSVSAAIDPIDAAQVDGVITSVLLRTLPNRSLVMARSLGSLRSGAAGSLITETSRVNAEFALLSNLPANVPVLGTVLGAGADLLVLTKNQAMMVLKLAAIFGRDFEDSRRLIAEIAPVVGAAFAWRTVARLLVGTLPTPVAIIPKTAMAYAGTYVVGRLARYYYEYGQRPTPQVTRHFAEQATREWRQVEAGATR